MLHSINRFLYNIELDTGSGGNNPPPAPPEGGNPPPAEGSGKPSDEGAPPAEGGKGSPPEAGDWRSSLPEDLREDPALKHIGDVQSLAKSYVHAQKMVGADKVTIPAKNADPSSWREVWHRLGLPREADQYEIEAPEGVNEEFVSGLKKVAFESGVLPEHAAKLMTYVKEQADAANEKMDAENKAFIEKNMDSLKKHWGNSFEKNLGLANVALKSLGDPEINKWLDATGLKSDPMVIRLMGLIGGKYYKEDPMYQGDTSITPSDAQSEINRIMGDPKHPYFDKSHPEHRSAVSEMARLHKHKVALKG